MQWLEPLHRTWAFVSPELPYTDFHTGSKPVLRFLPAGRVRYEFDLRGKTIGHRTMMLRNNSFTLPADLEVGEYVARVRWSDSLEEPFVWSHLSDPLRMTLYGPEADIDDLQKNSHHLSLLCVRDPCGAVTLVDPEGMPPVCDVGNGRWFPTHWYEGRTGLYNEIADYYRDPLGYLEECIEQLVLRRARFVTWRDVIEGRVFGNGLEILIQLDVDGGARSLEPVAEMFLHKGVRASVQSHRRAQQWYSFSIEDSLPLLHRLVEAGWEIGYHNNCLSEVMAEVGNSSIDNELLETATQRFVLDVSAMRDWFDVSIYTHHGGNIPNALIKPPSNLGVVGVDRPVSPKLWSGVLSSSSDGGFLVSPRPLRRRIEKLDRGLHFLRLHPFKYGNYVGVMDQPPRDVLSLARVGVAVDEAIMHRAVEEATKERAWLAERRQRRLTVCLAYPREERPISSRFRPLADIQDQVEHYLVLRGERMRRQYPWREGDPRVIWWRMLDAWGVESGEVLNVGTLPPERHGESQAFLRGDVRVTEMDIDSIWEPDILCDVVTAPEVMNGRFAATLLMGLPFFASPSGAVDACHRLIADGGRGLFAFVADTHRQRGALWNPDTRPLWRKDREPLDNIGLQGKLWSFDDRAVEVLFSSWSMVRYEPISHYWFVVAEK